MKSGFVFAVSSIIVVLFLTSVVSCKSVTVLPKQKKDNKIYKNSLNSSKKSQNYKITKNPKPSDKGGLSVNSISFPSLQPLPPLFQKTIFLLENVKNKLSITHPYVVHFPIVLIFFAPIFWTLNYFKPRPEFLFSAKLFLWLGFLSVVLAMITGHGMPSTRNEAILLEQHAIWGELVVWCIGATLAVRVFLKRWSARPWYHYSIIFLLVLANLSLWSATGSGNALLGF